MDTKKPKILFVDDGIDKLQGLIQYLHESGFEVREFGSGESARDYILASGDYDVAIIDRRLRGDHGLYRVTGEELMEISKRTNPKKPIVSFSAYYDKPPYADRVLEKPAFLEDLEDLVSYIKNSI